MKTKAEIVNNWLPRCTDTALNFRSSLNFLNSLLLPVLAFLLGNLKDVIEFFKK